MGMIFIDAREKSSTTIHQQEGVSKVRRTQITQIFANHNYLYFNNIQQCEIMKFVVICVICVQKTLLIDPLVGESNK